MWPLPKPPDKARRALCCSVLMQVAAAALAQLDALSSLAAVARSPRYSRPSLAGGAVTSRILGWDIAAVEQHTNGSRGCSLVGGYWGMRTKHQLPLRKHFSSGDHFQKVEWPLTYAINAHVSTGSEIPAVKCTADRIRGCTSAAPFFWPIQSCSLAPTVASFAAEIGCALLCPVSLGGPLAVSDASTLPPHFAGPGQPCQLVIHGGRHPMLEAQLAGTPGD